MLKMVKYKNLSGSSGVVAYEVGEDSISIRFEDGDIYLYNYSSTGFRKIEEMKRLAGTGNGLATYINKNVKNKYAKKV